MKAKTIAVLITTAVTIALLCLIGGGLWWGATVAYGWFDSWARGDEAQVRHEWHLHGRTLDNEAESVTTGEQLSVDVLREVYVEDANDPDGAELIGAPGSPFRAGDAHVAITERPKHGTAAVAQDGTLTYTSDGNYVGDDSVTWTVKLTQAPETVTAVLTIKVGPEPDGESWDPPGKRWPDAYENCDDARAHGAAPVRKGDRGYAPWLDADDDGIGCDAG
nr:excalibur calcium-binding domain-containing protein [Streptomyces sp. NBC_01175]